MDSKRLEDARDKRESPKRESDRRDLFLSVCHVVAWLGGTVAPLADPREEVSEIGLESKSAVSPDKGPQWEEERSQGPAEKEDRDPMVSLPAISGNAPETAGEETANDPAEREERIGEIH
jgi:hypothetical protein